MCKNAQTLKKINASPNQFVISMFVHFLEKNAKENRYNMLEESRFIMMAIGYFSSHFALMLEENLKWGR